MAFWGKEFIFDGISCTQYGLEMYDIDGCDSLDSPTAGTVAIVEETIGDKWKPFFYGTRFENKLEFELVFGINEGRVDSEEYLTRYEIDQIATWLTGYNEYKPLVFMQDDISVLHFKAMITSLSINTNGNMPYSFRATVTCDSPYAYEPQSDTTFTINGTRSVSFNNNSCLNGYYKPVIIYRPNGGGSFRITNVTDNNRMFAIENIPNSVHEITINSDTCVITNDMDLNLYGLCNFKFVRLKKGANTLTITGNGTLIIRCEFPHNIGG